MLTKPFRALLFFMSIAVVALAGCQRDIETPFGDAPVLVVSPPAGQLPEGVAPTAYRLNLITDPAADTFSGQVEIDIKLDAPHARIWMHSVDQTIDRAIARLPDGTEQEATFARSRAEGGVSRLDFVTPLPAGNATLIIDYSAPYNLALAGLYKATQKDRPYLATQMEPFDARRMVPSFDEPRFKTPWTFTVTAPAGNQIITNGALKTITTLDNGLIQHEFATTRAIQSYLIALAVGPYDLRDGGALPSNEIRPRSVAFRGFAPAGKGEQLQTAMDITNEMLTWLEAYFDYPYPYGKLDLIAVPDFAYGAMENAGAIIYREGALLISDRTSLDRRRATLTTHGHELAHQWFGNLVTPKWWDDIWLNEAFATWISYKTMDAVYPGTGFDLAPQRAAIGVMGSDSLASARQIRNPITRNADIWDAFDGITFRKGGGVLSMFENYVGEDAFRAGIRLHMRRFEDSVADIDDFMASLAEGSGDTGIIDSFKSFILQPGIPYLHAELTCPAVDAGLITVTQTRFAPLGSKIDTEASRWIIPFSIRMSGANGDRTIKQMLSEAVTEIPLDGGCPDWIMPNADGKGYWRFNTSDGGWQALIAAYDTLTPGEQLVLADSAVAAFQAGQIPADLLLNILSVNANGDWAAAKQPLGSLRGYMNHLSDDEAKDALRDFIMAIYSPRFQALASRSEDTLSEGERVLKTDLYKTLIEAGRMDTERVALANAARAYVGVTGTPDPSALAPADVTLAVAVAAEDGDRRFYRAALDFARTTENQRERRAILNTLAVNLPEADILDLMREVQGEAFQGQEAWSVALAALRNKTAQDAAWTQFTTDFARTIARTPSIRIPQTATAVGAFCEPDKLRTAVSFIQENSDLIPGYERKLAQSIEQAELCIAFRTSKSDELGQALKAR